MNTKFREKFLEQVGKPLILTCSLSRYSSFKVGGEADYFVEVGSKKEIKEAIFLAREFSIPYFIIGGGYNLLFDDAGFRGLIIKNSIKGLSAYPPASLKICSGNTIEELLQFCVKHELGGIEYMAGIPGTLGGAVYGNAGAFGQCIGDRVAGASVLDKDGEESPVKKGDFRFDYRWSSLKETGKILLSVDFLLHKETSGQIRTRIEENLKKRKKKHPPLTVASAGSYFKNPDPTQKKTPSAAYLLDKVGAKEIRRGDAAVSSAHANFIINEKTATAQDILDLAQELKRRVKDAFGVELEEEVIYLPADPSVS
jgi:UDP-N-acetylmuramate dehydrogenase